MACLPIGLGFDPHRLIHFESKVRRSSDLFGSQAPHGAQRTAAAPRFDQLEALRFELGKRLACRLWIHFGFMIRNATSRLEPLYESLNPGLLLLAIGLLIEDCLEASLHAALKSSCLGYKLPESQTSIDQRDDAVALVFEPFLGGLKDFLLLRSLGL